MQTIEREAERTGQTLATTAGRPPAPIEKPKRAPKVGGKLKAALDLMVFGPDTGENEGLALDWLTAARTANYAVPTMRRMLLLPHVQRYLKEQRQVLRASASAQNISYAVQMRAKAKNEMARLGAMKFIEGQDAEEERKTAARTPGVVIQIIQSAALTAHQHRNDDKLLIDNETVSQVGPITNGTDNERGAE